MKKQSARDEKMDRIFAVWRYEFHPVRRSIVISAAVALSSEFYMSVFISDFRVSMAVVLFPVLLLTLGIQLDAAGISVLTAAIVFLTRTVLLAAGGGIPEKSILSVLPGAAFYLFYGLLFRLQLKDRRAAGLPEISRAVFLCDFVGNILEMLFRIVLTGERVETVDMLGSLFCIAVVRTVLVTLIIFFAMQYRNLQVREEQEERYRRLFLMITGLKSELYLMRKNCGEIERVMGNAYRLSESIQDERYPAEMQKMTLDIARDVHEIKKDYYRIIQGIEETVDRDYDEDEMRFRDVAEILEDTAIRMIREKKLDIHLIFDCRDNFLTRSHYMLMTILKNLVSNSIEAIAGDRKSGTITVSEDREGDDFVFRVTDNGPGIQEKNLKKIFRIGYSTKFDEKTGNIFRGVGLAGVQNTVEEQLDGTIRVDSVPGEHTTFTVTIPAEMIESGTVAETGDTQDTETQET